MTDKRSVLVVDDDVDIREAIRDALEDEGYDISEAGDGQEALEWLGSNPLPAAILLDWNMAPMSGPQFIAEVSRSSRLRELPVIVLTADPRALEKVKGGGYAEWLMKPFRLEQLFGVLDRYCG